jgi:putative thioredoxin
LKLMTVNNPEIVLKEGEDILKEIEIDPKNLNLRYKLAVHYFENFNYEDSIDNLLEIIQIERNWNDRAAHKTLIHIFNFLGPSNSITIEGRKKLTKILY